MKPNASAPASMAASASSALVMPHTFTLISRRIALGLGGGGNPAQFLNFGTGILSLDERLADEHGMNSDVQKLFHVAAGMNATLADDQLTGRNARRQTFGDREIGRKGREVPIIDADHPGIGNPFQDRVQLTFMMGFNQHVQIQLAGERMKIDELSPFQRGDNQ